MIRMGGGFVRSEAALETERYGLVISRRLQVTVLSIAAFDDREQLVALLSGAMGTPIPDPCRSSTGRGVVLLAYGPARWLAVAETVEGSERLRALALACRPYAAVVDQSHGWVCSRITGPRCRDVLAAGSSIDIRPTSFLAGHCAATALGKISVLIHALPAQNAFDIYVPRSYAHDLAGWMLRALATVQN
jgi:sarcosine oxidase subunit gamma